MRALRIKTVGLLLSALLLVTYTLYVLFDLLLPGWTMYQLWQGLFPGFSWSVVGFLIGLVEVVVYGFYIAVIFVPTYNYLNRREGETIGAATPKLTLTGQH
jgi:hypothetical protein